jgi:hypothetical protein
MDWSYIILLLIYFVVPICFLIIYSLISYLAFKFVKVKNIILKSVILLLIYYLMALIVINVSVLIINLMLPADTYPYLKPFTPLTSCSTDGEGRLDYVFCNFAMLLQFILVGISVVGAGVFWVQGKILERGRENKAS